MGIVGFIFNQSLIFSRLAFPFLGSIIQPLPPIQTKVTSKLLAGSGLNFHQTKMAAPKIVFYFDTVSPFAYIAYYVLRHDPVFAECSITYVPILLGGLFKMCSNTAPLMIKNKDKWIDRERQIWASTFDVPMQQQRPPNFPPRTLPIMRALAALESTTQSSLTSALDALWEEFFVHHARTEEPAELRRILSKALESQGLADETLRRAASDDADGGKAILTANTEKAFRDGAFGVPWLVCTRSDGQRESFWGVDHLGRLAAFLQLDKPTAGKWKSLL